MSPPDGSGWQTTPNLAAAMSRSRRHLLLLPGALVVGHLGASVATGHAAPGGSGAWSWALVQVMLCAGLPLAVWAALGATIDGWRGRQADASPGVLVAQQVVGFVGIDLLEHAVTGTSPWQALRGGAFWASLLVHVAVALLAWLALRLANHVGTVLARRARSGSPRSTEAPQTDAGRAAPAPIVDISSLSRRGPPTARLAPLHP